VLLIPEVLGSNLSPESTHTSIHTEDLVVCLYSFSLIRGYYFNLSLGLFLPHRVELIFFKKSS